MPSQGMGQTHEGRNGLLISFGGALGALVIILGLYLWSEGDTPPGQHFWEGLENAIIALMGEYPDRPTTPAGRILQLLLLVFGTFILGAISGRISAIFVTRALRDETTMPTFKHHILLCNWNAKAPSIIAQLLEGNRRNPTDIVVVSASPLENRDDWPRAEHIHFVQDDPTHHATLERLQVAQAKAVILLADEDSQGPDEKNALIALAIKHIEGIPGQEKDIHVVSELVNLNRRRHLQEAGVDEVVSILDYGAGVIAQSAMFANMSVVYQQLLTYSDDSNEFYFLLPGQYPASLQGKTFPELSQWVSQYSATQPSNPMVLIGVKRASGEILLNPRSTCFDHLAPTDTLVVMAFHAIEAIG